MDTCKDHLQSEAHMKNIENTMWHTLSNAQFSVGGKKKTPN